jgi:2-polyprenyl-3-methyl-5-hydroxy-6-metoxy-1,4-benzoquinol methylase
MVCQVCGSSSIKERFKIFGSKTICACANCGVEFLYPQLNDEELKKLYSETYYTPWGLAGTAENEALKRMKIATFNLRLDLVKSFVQKGKLLDVGCATGYLLEAAKEKGFDVYGVEFSEYSAQLAKQKFGNEKIHNGILEDSPFANGFFEVITMFDLIEHVRIPQVVLEKARELLSENGLIMISTPDIGSLSHSLMGKKWTHYKLEHFFYFNKASMNLAAERSGLKLVHYERSKKALTLNYMYLQFKTYKHWLFTPLSSMLYAIASKKLRERNFYFPIGEMTVVLKK